MGIELFEIKAEGRLRDSVINDFMAEMVCFKTFAYKVGQKLGPVGLIFGSLVKALGMTGDKEQ